MRRRHIAQHSLNRRLPSQGGQATVEFALTTVFIVLLVVSTIELIMMIYTYNTMAGAAKEGVRYAIVHGSNSSSPSGPSTGTSSDCSTNITGVTNAVQSYAKLSFHNVSAMTVSVCYLDGNNQPPARVQVQIHYPYIPWFRRSWSVPQINAASEGRIVF
jgi:Flp pilus assembly protein TadG